MSSPDVPPAAGVRRDWSELPPELRRELERWLGGPVVAATTQAGGFSPGIAVRLRTANGRRVFLKAAGPAPNPMAPRFHRREASIVAALPASVPAPRLLRSYDEGESGWVVLVFDDVEGQQPTLPWRPAELERVLETLQALAATLTPSPIPPAVAGSVSEWLGAIGRGWRRLLAEPPPDLDAWSARHLAALASLEAAAPAAAVGETLLHLDIRADNLLLTAEDVFVVDWPHARLGAAWVDLVLLAPSLEMQGGPPPEELLARLPAGRAANPAAVSAVVAALAGYFTWQALRPPPPGLPTLRAFQSAQAVVARNWLARLTGWT